jgi:hypothetical protein
MASRPSAASAPSPDPGKWWLIGNGGGEGRVTALSSVGMRATASTDEEGERGDLRERGDRTRDEEDSISLQ